ncbi:hypothetical protein Maq22A_2p42470 (plasmid) [Methylobacterium aquaticum]|uniref:Uncharacterized protein n=2 Tax=Methylobacterium TaxID=407 RepID=A0A0C6FC01_9HYPH|nr:hypothetical protein Maq22A_2p42470 [Methylobacterium aquaticum]
MRKFLLGSKDFGFFYGYAESHVRFVHNRSDGNNVECVFPVAALRTPAATAMIAAFFAAAQVPPPSANRLDLYVSEVQTTLAVVPSAPAQNFKVPEPPKGNTQPSDSPKA